MTADAFSLASLASLLILLDLTTAFDTVYHRILLHHLHSSIGPSDITLAWLTLYLTDRSTEYVFLGGAASQTRTLSPVVSLKDQSLAQSSSLCTSSALVMSSAGMEYLSTATLMSPNSTSKPNQLPLQPYQHLPGRDKGVDDG